MQASTQFFLQQTTQTCRKALYVAAFFSLFVNLLVLTVPLYTLQLFDRVLTSHSYETLIFLTVIATLALGVMTLLDIARSRVLGHISHWLDTVLSPAALHKCPDEILQGRQYGPQALRDIVNIRQFISGAGITALFDAPWLPIYLVVIFLLHPLLGVLALAGAVVIFSLALLNEKVTRQPLLEANEKNLEAQQYIDASLRHAETIQGMGMMTDIINHWESKNKPVLALQMTASHSAGIILAASKFVRLTLQLLVMGLGAGLVLQNQLTGGAMIAGSILLARALAPVEQAMGAWKQLLAARQAYHRLQQHFAQSARVITTINLPAPRGLISLNKVLYRTQQVEKPIIYGVSFQIAPGSLVALIGPSGAGKSTLARLIVGALKPTAGEVRLDGADVYHWNRQEFGRYVGYMPQDIELLPGTVKDNIARLGEIDDSAVIAAAQLARIHEIILRLPKGYDTQIGANSAYTLSGGQRQRVALARALYKNPCLLVLDEPNANLDTEGEQALADALLAMKDKGSTQLIIAHRPALMRYVDYIIVLNEGTVQMMGPRDKVLQELQQKSTTAIQPAAE